MKPFLIIQLRPEDVTANNEYEAILQFGGLQPEETVRVRAEVAGLPEINLEEYSGIIVGGSPFDISTPAAEKSEIQNKIEADFSKLFDQVVPQDFPFLGACSGNGLLGNYCGATISRQYGETVHAVDITITPAGLDDPLLADVPNPFRALVGHKEACDATPPGATLLASGRDCPVQMFRVGHNVYATQFHPEADAAGFITRINTYKHNGYFKPEEADDLIVAIEPEDTSNAQAILKRFVERYRQR